MTRVAAALLLPVLAGCATLPSEDGADPPASSASPFPGIEGAGLACRGGAGGRTLYVTTLDDTGPGSLRAAIDARGPRTILFKVSGEIKVVSAPLWIEEPYVTIDGFSAPGRITLTGRQEQSGNAFVGIGTHDVAIRGIEFAKGTSELHQPAGDGQGPGGLGLWDDSQRIVLDHCSFRWAQDENLTLYGRHCGEISIQWCIIAEPHSHHPTNVIIGPEHGTRGVDIHHCLIANGSHRNPLFYRTEGRFVNNVIYNWHWFALGMPYPGTKLDLVNNVWKKGPLSVGPRREVAAVPGQSLYLAGNLGPNCQSAEGDQWNLVEQIRGLNFEPQGQLADPAAIGKRTTALPGNPITTYPAHELIEKILAGVGASKFRSPDDARIVAECRRGAGSFKSQY